ncbi:MAG: hypothetical protein ACSNEK_08885 [Parachlamydiaceae bacterium]
MTSLVSSSSSSSSSSEDFRVTLFGILDDAVQKELDKLREKNDLFDCAEEKINKIENAIIRLAQAITHQCQLNENHPIAKRLRIEKISFKEVESADLSTFDAMLDAQFASWETDEEREQEFRGLPEGYVLRPSLRQALNIARNNIFNIFAPESKRDRGPLWGKTDTLKSIENRIRELTRQQG